VISTGEILRDAAQRGTDFGLQAKAFTDHGELVPDDLMTPFVLNRLREPDSRNGFLLDGFPRTVQQAAELDRFLEDQGLDIDAVLHLVVDREELVRRLSGRRVCSKCGENYHIQSRPPKVPGVCDRDGAPLIQRDDDRPEAIRQRLIVNERDTAPVAEYYRDQGLLSRIDGNAPLDRVTAAIEAVVDAAAGRPRRSGSPGEVPAEQPAPRR
jgi:adenylate kinase